MDVFIKTKSFNPSLVGKAVRVKGFDIDGNHWDRLFLVKGVSGEYIDLANNVCQETSIHMESFEHADDALKISVLEERE